MTPFRCDACGRELAGDTAFCPYCGADRRAPDAAASPEPASPAAAAAPIPPPVPIASVAAEPSPPARPAPAPPEPVPPTPQAAEPTRKPRGAGCATPLLVALLAILAGVSWCALHRPPTGGAPAVAGATAARPLRISRRWRTTPLPGDAPASARFAVSSDTALRLRAGGRIYAVRPRHALQLPDDVGESFDMRAADYVSAEDAAHAKAALITLRGR